MPRQQALRQLLTETRTLLADQGSLGFVGAEVGAAALRLPVAKADPPAEEALGDAASELAAVQRDLGPCTRCRLAQTRTKLVFGTGASSAQLVFVGEGPGRDEDRQGLPFVGEAGRLLDRMLLAMKLGRDAVYITNVVKCRPPNNRFPEADEQASCSPFLWRQLAAIRPKVVVALGRLAAQTLLASKAPMGKVRGQWQTLAVPKPSLAAPLRDVAVMPTYHPAYLLRRPEDKILVWRDLQAVMARLA